MLADLIDDPLDVGFGQYEQILRPCAEPRSADRRLPGTFFAGYIEDFPSWNLRFALCSGRQRVGNLKQQRRFSDPRLSADQNRRSRHHAATENAVKLPDATLQSRCIGL